MGERGGRLAQMQTRNVVIRGDVSDRSPGLLLECDAEV